MANFIAKLASHILYDQNVNIINQIILLVDKNKEQLGRIVKGQVEENMEERKMENLVNQVEVKINSH